MKWFVGYDFLHFLFHFQNDAARFHRSSSTGLLLNTPTTACGSRVQSAQHYWTTTIGRREIGTDTPEFEETEDNNNGQDKDTKEGKLMAFLFWLNWAAGNNGNSWDFALSSL